MCCDTFVPYKLKCKNKVEKLMVAGLRKIFNIALEYKCHEDDLVHQFNNKFSI
jgi:hypothetical protein